eukprot:gene779-1095_t
MGPLCPPQGPAPTPPQAPHAQNLARVFTGRHRGGGGAVRGADLQARMAARRPGVGPAAHADGVPGRRDSARRQPR